MSKRGLYNLTYLLISEYHMPKKQSTLSYADLSLALTTACIHIPLTPSRPLHFDLLSIYNILDCWAKLRKSDIFHEIEQYNPGDSVTMVMQYLCFHHFRYREFPKVDSSKVEVHIKRKYSCNFLGTVYKNSSREVLMKILQGDFFQENCLIKPRYRLVTTNFKPVDVK